MGTKMVSLEQALAQHLTHIWFWQSACPGFLSNTFPYWQLLSALSTLLSFSQAPTNGCPCNLLCLPPSDLEQFFNSEMLWAELCPLSPS